MSDLIKGLQKKSKESVSNLTQSWLAKYEEDGLSAVTSLVQLMLHAAGNDESVISSEDVENVDVEALQAKLIPGDISSKYPLNSDKTFLSSFKLFWNKLVLQAGDVLFDEYLMGHLNIWIELTSNFEVRNLRHVGSLVGLEVVSALIQLHKKHAKLAKKKQDKLEDLETLIDGLFNTVFVVRYRDVWNELRAMCIKALGSWLLDFSSVMMDTKYIKYIGWALYDPKPNVRLEAVKALTTLYEAGEEFEALDKFTTRFQDRIGALPDDKDISVAVAGIKLCQLVAVAEKLKEDHVKHIYELLVDVHAQVRTAAAQFTLAVYFGEDAEEDDMMDSSAEKLGKLMEFVKEHEEILGNDVRVIVNSLPVSCGWLSDWETMSTMLLQDDDESSGREALLAEIVVTAMRKNSKKETFSGVFVNSIHKLLKRFKADADVVQSLVGMVSAMNPELFSSLHKAAHHKKVAELLSELFVSHNEPQLVNDIMAALVHLSNPAFPLASEARQLLQRTGDRLVKSFTDACNLVTSSKKDPQDAVFALNGALLRLSTATRMMDLATSSENFVTLKQIVDDWISGASVWPTDEIIMYALEAQVTDIMWALSRLLKGTNASGVNAVDELEIKRDDVLVLLEKVLASSETSVEVLALGTKCVTDLLNLFSPYLKRQSLGKLVVHCSTPLRLATMKAFHVVMEQEEAEDAEEEELDKQDALKHGVLERICKSVKIHSLPLECAAEVLIYLNEAGGDDNKACIKDMLSSLRKEQEKLGKGEYEYRTIFQTLKLAFERYQKSNEYDEDRKRMHDLAASLVRSYGVVPSGVHKKSMVLLMQEATPFALGKGDVGFVFLKECLLPFTSRMPQPELILEFFEKQQIPEGAENSVHFSALEEFRGHLKKLADPKSFKTPLSKRSTKKKAKVNPKMMLEFESGEEPPVEDEDDDNENDQENSRSSSATPLKRGRGKKASKGSASSTKKKNKVALEEQQA